MKKLAIIMVLLGAATVLSAQPRAAGMRAGLGVEVSYEHYLGTPSGFAEAELGIKDDGFRLTGLYNWILYTPSWTDRGTWHWYAGPGITAGYASRHEDDGLLFGLVGQIGVEYTFWFPLQLSADMRPTFAVVRGHFYEHGLLGLVPTVSVRYKF